MYPYTDSFQVQRAQDPSRRQRRQRPDVQKKRRGRENNNPEDCSGLIIYRLFDSSQIKDGSWLATMTVVLPLGLSFEDNEEVACLLSTSVALEVEYLWQ